MSKSWRMIAAAGLLAGLGGIAFAQTNSPAAPPEHGGAMMRSDTPGGQGESGMMHGDMHQKMSRMMDTCTRMMESMMPSGGNAPAHEN